MKTRIIDSGDLKADFFRCDLPRKDLIITFTERTHRDLEGPGFGTSFLLKRNCDVLAIKTNRDIWYSNLTEDHIQAISSFLSTIGYCYTEYITYGSSMGAYAAIRFAGAFGASKAIAISPIFDITLDWESRWNDDIPHLRSRSMMHDYFLGDKIDYFFVYDPHSPDSRHVSEYKKIIPAEYLHLFCTPYSGHPSGPFLRDTGILSELIYGVISTGEFPQLKAKMSSFRKKSRDYLFWLANKALVRKKYNWALSLNQQALCADPKNAEFHIQRARILHAAGDDTSAADHAAQAVMLNPANPYMLGYRDILLKRLAEKTANNAVSQ